jgi:hypothetical protein
MNSNSESIIKINKDHHGEFHKEQWDFAINYA